MDFFFHDFVIKWKDTQKAHQKYPPNANIYAELAEATED